MRVKSLFLLVALGAGVTAVAVPETAFAQEPSAEDKSEALRLRDEMKKLSGRNAWTGVEKNYDLLMKLAVPFMFDDHFMGAQAAKYQGKTYEVYERLTLAKAIDPQPDILTELEALDAQYGRVHIKGTLKILPTVNVAMPFDPSQRKSIEWAQKVLLETGSFKGMLPIDIEYTIVGPMEVKFTPRAGPDWLVLDLSSAKQYKLLGSGVVPAPVPDEPPPDGPPDDPPPDGEGVVKTPKPDKPEKPESGGTQGNIDTAGPVVMAGYNYLMSAEPPSPGGPQELVTAGDNGEYTAGVQPGDMAGSGVQLELGAEVVFTGKLFAVSGTVAYTGMYGTDSLQGFRGWLAGSLRPGDLRISVGPTYGVYEGGGLGVASWFDVGQNPQTYPVDSLEFVGRSLAGGAQFTAGYGVLPIGPLMGTVEIGGAWQTDGVRSYVGGGLRVGVVPKIERFKG